MENPFTLTSNADVHRYSQQFYMHKWYEALSAHTFLSSFVHLTQGEAMSMVLFYRVHSLNADKDIWKKQNKKDYMQIARKLQENMAQGPKQPSLFVRLSTRSPTDACLVSNDKFKTMVETELADVRKNNKESPTLPTPNEKLTAVCNVSLRVMEVKSVAQSLSILLSSERMYQDLNKALERANGSDWHMDIILREFVTLSVGNEFRGFACNKTLTAVSQYNSACYYPHLQGNEQQILIIDKIVAFYNSISDKVPYSACVIDFVLLGDLVKVVDINPFGPMTSASLFDWNKDRKLLQGNMDLFGDQFTTAQTTNTSPGDNAETSEKFHEDVLSSHEYSANNNWRTVLRVNKTEPSYITHEYVDSVFDKVYGAVDFEEEYYNKKKCAVM